MTRAARRRQASLERLEKLADGGRLVIPVGSLDSQALWVAERHGNRASRAQLQNACFVPLIGRHGWQEGS